MTVTVECRRLGVWTEDSVVLPEATFFFATSGLVPFRGDVATLRTGAGPEPFLLIAPAR